jgi:hypothetical protein
MDRNTKENVSGAYGDYFTPRWLVLYGYVLIVFIATPYLPLLIQQASSIWPSGSVSRFVFGVEIFIGVLLMVTAGAVFLFNKRKFLRFILITGGLIGVSYLFYLIIPNPYELTHLPEYAIMSVLILQAIKELEGKRREKVSENRVYFKSALITGVLGSIDELYQGVLPMRYFTWYDIFLNGLGGILGLTLFWGITRESVNGRT